MEDDYCPIKINDKICGAGGACNHNQCWEKMHYRKMPSELEEKMEYWRKTKRGDESRWKNICKEYNLIKNFKK